MMQTNDNLLTAEDILLHLKAIDVKKVLLLPFRGGWYMLYTFFGFSSLHGFAHVTAKKRSPVEQGVWLIALVLSFWGAFTLSFQTWRRFQSNPTVVSMERNYKDWNTSFASFALCPEAKYDEDNLQMTLDEFDHVKDKGGLKNFLKQLGQATYGTFDKIKINFEQLSSFDYWLAIVKMQFKFQYKVSNSNPEHYNVVRMNKFMSEIGLCYSYNSDSTYYNEPSYWEQNKWTHLGKFPIFRSNPLDGDIFAQLRNMNSGYDLFIYSPSEFPDVALAHVKGHNNSYLTIDLTVVSIVSTKATEGLSIQQRKCRLQHESNLITSPIYSYNLCRMECRMKEANRLCNCVPYFYRPTDRYKVCDVPGMHCLQQYTDQLVRLVDNSTGKKISCHCEPLCHEEYYQIDSENEMPWSLGTNLKVGFIKYPKMRLKRDILFGYTDLLVAFGGSAGLFLGCSILSAAEIVYFFLIRSLYYIKYKLPLPFA